LLGLNMQVQIWEGSAGGAVDLVGVPLRRRVVPDGFRVLGEHLGSRSGYAVQGGCDCFDTGSVRLEERVKVQ
jgi:hypothetical protein